MGALKKQHCPQAPAATKKTLSLVDQTTENAAHKVEIERMKKLLSEKIKNPELARKAAMIISEMLNSKD